MALVFHRGLAIPLWAVAFFAIALAAPPHPMPPITVVLGISVIALTMMAMVQWRSTSRRLVELLPSPGRHRQMARETAIPIALIPGAREPGMLTRGASAPNEPIPDGPGTMDTATVAERRREGGGAPNQRRSAGGSRWNIARTMLHSLGVIQ